MSELINQLNYCYDVHLLNKEGNNLIQRLGDTLNLRKRADHSDEQAKDYGLNSLYSYDLNKYIINQDHYTKNIDLIKNTYIESVIESVKRIAECSDLAIGRARIVTLQPKYALTYHTDTDSALRYHIPIVTNDNIMFIVADKVYRMKQQGTLYTIDTNYLHTVVNASKTPRIHLILDGYRR